MKEEYEDQEMLEEVDEEMLEEGEVSFDDIKEHITGPAISTVVHIILLALLGTMIVFEAPKESNEIMVEMKKVEIKEPPPPPPPPDPPPPSEQVPDEKPVERPTEIVDVTVEVDDISVETPNNVDLPSLLSMKMSNSALSLPVNAGGGRRGGGIPGKFLGTGGSGNRFMFIIDFSSSMSKQQTFVVKAHLIAALNAFEGKGRVAVLFFSRFVWLPEDKPTGTTATPRWIVPNGKNMEVFVKHIVQEPGSGGTNWELPLRVSLDMEEKPDVIFFMTDGAVNKGIVQNCLNLVKEKGKDIIINTISFGMKGGGGLEALAKMSKGGEYKAYSDSQLGTMAKGLSLPTSFTDNNDFDYSVKTRGSMKKIKKEQDPSGLEIK